MTRALVLLLLLLAVPASGSELRFTTNPHACAMKTVWNSVQHDLVWVQDGCNNDTSRVVPITAIRIYRKGPGEPVYRQIALCHPGDPFAAEVWHLRFDYPDTGSVYCVQESATSKTVRGCPSNSVTLPAQ